MISGLERAALVALVRDLYELSADNKRFVHARLGIGSDALAECKKIVARCMSPDPDHPVQIARAKKAIADYRKATPDAAGEIDLLIHFLECGTRFTLDYGYADERFYDSLVGVYDKAARTVARMPDAEQRPLRERLRRLTQLTRDVGWGYHDDLCGIYYSRFPENP